MWIKFIKPLLSSSIFLQKYLTKGVWLFSLFPFCTNMKYEYDFRNIWSNHLRRRPIYDVADMLCTIIIIVILHPKSYSSRLIPQASRIKSVQKMCCGWLRLPRNSLDAPWMRIDNLVHEHKHKSQTRSSNPRRTLHTSEGSRVNGIVSLPKLGVQQQ